MSFLHIVQVYLSTLYVVWRFKTIYWSWCSEDLHSVRIQLCSYCSKLGCVRGTPSEGCHTRDGQFVIYSQSLWLSWMPASSGGVVCFPYVSSYSGNLENGNCEIWINIDSWAVIFEGLSESKFSQYTFLDFLQKYRIYGFWFYRFFFK